VRPSGADSRCQRQLCVADSRRILGFLQPRRTIVDLLVHLHVLVDALAQFDLCECVRTRLLLVCGILRIRLDDGNCQCHGQGEEYRPADECAHGLGLPDVGSSTMRAGVRLAAHLVRSAVSSRAVLLAYSMLR
jgi:hypothetical protein